jgi:hypothetical protein
MSGCSPQRVRKSRLPQVVPVQEAAFLPLTGRLEWSGRSSESYVLIRPEKREVIGSTPVRPPRRVVDQPLADSTTLAVVVCQTPSNAPYQGSNDVVALATERDRRQQDNGTIRSALRDPTIRR